jgi:hypothetical protein
MEHIKTIEELLEMRGEALKEYLLALPAAERQKLSSELLKAKAEREAQKQATDLNENASK